MAADPQSHRLWLAASHFPPWSAAGLKFPTDLQAQALLLFAPVYSLILYISRQNFTRVWKEASASNVALELFCAKAHIKGYMECKCKDG